MFQANAKVKLLQLTEMGSRISSSLIECAKVMKDVGIEPN
jgi:hypothetical protein